eukprot:gene13339-4187_t
MMKTEESPFQAFKYADRKSEYGKCSTASNRVDPESDTDEEETGMNVAITGEYLQIAKLIKYAKRGNQTATVLALVALNDHDMKKPSVQASLIHLDGVNLLVNLLRTDDSRSKIAALKILRATAANKLVAEVIIRLSGVEILVDLLSNSSDNVVAMSADIISDIAASRRARKLLQANGGLITLLKNLKLPELEQEIDISRQNSRMSSRLSGKRSSKSHMLQHAALDVPLEVVRASASAVWNCCRSPANRKVVTSSDILPFLIRLLEKTTDETIHMPVIGIIHSCAVDTTFKKYMLSAGLLYHVVRAMKSDRRQFQILALKAYSVCGDEIEARDQIRELNGLGLMHGMLLNGRNGDTDMLIAATEAVWKSITDNHENVNWFKRHSIVNDLSELLKSNNSEVIVNSLGIVTEFSYPDLENRKLLLENNVIQLVIGHLETTDCQIIMAASRAAKAVSQETESRRTIIGDEGFRFLWSHLKSRNENVVSTVLDAIYDIVQDPEETATTVRSFLGGIEILITLMKSKNIEIRNSACKVVSRIECDEENLEVLDDYELSSIIIDLCDTADDELRKALCGCIVSYAIHDEYRQKLRETIPYLGEWLTSSDFDVKKLTTTALFKLSCNRDNSLLIYEKGAVKHLVALITCDDQSLQESAAECVRNIRLTTVRAVENHFR